MRTIKTFLRLAACPLLMVAIVALTVIGLAIDAVKCLPAMAKHFIPMG